MNDPSDLRELLGNGTTKEGQTRLIFHPSDGPSAFAAQLADTARQIEEVARGAITLEEGQGTELLARPGLTIAREGHGRIHYLALPEGLEAPPFFEAVAAVAKGPIEAVESAGWVRELATVDAPAELLVFVASTCPHCPRAARAANRLALASERVTAHIIDAQRFPDLAERFGARAVPMTVLDRQLGVTGVLRPDELTERILSRGSPEHGRAVFRSLVDAGRFADAAERVIRGDGGAHFLTAWGQSTMSSRVGLLLVAEEVLETAPSGFDRLVPSLVEVLGSPDGALRGDTADLLGQIGDARAVEALEALCVDPNPDVAEVAADAIEQIRQAGRRGRD